MSNILMLIFFCVIGVLFIALLAGLIILVRKNKALISSQNVVNLQLDTSADKKIADLGRAVIEHSSDVFFDESGLVRLLDFINNSLIQLTLADGGAILLVDDFEDLINVKSFEGEFPPPYKVPSEFLHKILQIETHFRNAHFNFTGNIFGEIVKSGEAELITDPLSDKRIFNNVAGGSDTSENAQTTQSDYFQARSYIFVPLKLKDTVIGLIALARKKKSPGFTVENFQAAQTLCDFSSLAIKNIYSFKEITEHMKITREANIATKLQNSLYLKKLPVISTLSLGTFFNAAEGVCGDYFDVIVSRKDRISFLLADVPGKGIAAVVIMTMIRAIMRVIVNTTQTAGTLLGWLNRGLSGENVVDHFAGAVLMNYDPTTKNIQFSTAGTIPILHFSDQEKIWKKISTESEPLGVAKHTIYSDRNIQLNKDDIIVLYTNGLTEAVDDKGNPYSVERLKQVIVQHMALRAGEIATKVNGDLQQFTGAMGAHDDQSLLILKMQ
ncbi:MAG: GAF domain-containing SpoIIE family protein phosphatase [Spirochaetales bacterium]